MAEINLYGPNANYELQTEQTEGIPYEGEYTEHIPLEDYEEGLGSYDLRMANGRQMFLDEENIIAIQPLDEYDEEVAAEFEEKMAQQ